MTITFFSNFLLLHQTPFCEAMVGLIGDGFRFVATTPIPEERLKMGYEDLNHTTPYVVTSYDSIEGMREAQRLALESDVVILGAAPVKFIYERLKQNKLTFRYSERYFKRGRWRLLDPRVMWSHFKNDFRFRNKPYYMLCASAYTAPDCRFIFSYPGKCLKWGYFPEVKPYDIDELMAAKHSDTPEILWVGRMIDWKHPEMAIKVAKFLNENGIDFHLTMIGEGPMRKIIEAKVSDLKLENFVEIKDFMPQKDVRRHMEHANIFLFTSDRQEGWGAVLNEAMNSGCAVVANDEIGSVPFMITPGKNGLIYHKRVKDLCRQTEQLLSNPSEIDTLGRNAYATMQGTWNADAATSRLLDFIYSLSKNHPSPYTYGHLSLS